jgi:hypothetical protein
MCLGEDWSKPLSPTGLVPAHRGVRRRPPHGRTESQWKVIEELRLCAGCLVRTTSPHEQNMGCNAREFDCDEMEESGTRSPHYLFNIDFQPSTNSTQCMGYSTQCMDCSTQYMDFEALMNIWGTQDIPRNAILILVVLEPCPDTERQATYNHHSVKHGRIHKHSERKCPLKLGTTGQRSRSVRTFRIWNCMLFSSESGTDAEAAAVSGC